MDTDALNANLRPLTIYALVALGVAFFGALGSILLYRYAAHGEISWEGLTAFMVGVVGPVVQHFQNRNGLKRIQAWAQAQGQAQGAPQ